MQFVFEQNQIFIFPFGHFYENVINTDHCFQPKFEKLICLSLHFLRNVAYVNYLFSD